MVFCGCSVIGSMVFSLFLVFLQWLVMVLNLFWVFLQWFFSVHFVELVPFSRLELGVQEGIRFWRVVRLIGMLCFLLNKHTYPEKNKRNHLLEYLGSSSKGSKTRRICIERHGIQIPP